jgi:hypothetical protein
MMACATSISTNHLHGKTKNHFVDRGAAHPRRCSFQWKYFQIRESL